MADKKKKELKLQLPNIGSAVTPVAERQSIPTVGSSITPLEQRPQLPTFDNPAQIREFHENQVAVEDYDKSEEPVLDLLDTDRQEEQAKRSKEAIKEHDKSGEGFFSSLFRIAQGPVESINQFDRAFGISNSLKTKFGVDLQLGEDTFFYDVEKDLKLAPRNTFEALGQAITQFLTPFGPAFKIASKGTKLLGLFKKSPKLKAALDGTIAGLPVDAFGFSPDDPNLAATLLATKVISEDSRIGALTKQYLANNPEDTKAERQLKNALTGALVGGLGETIIGLGGRVLGKTVKKQIEDTSLEIGEGMVKDLEQMKRSGGNLDQLLNKLPDDGARIDEEVAFKVKNEGMTPEEADVAVRAENKLNGYKTTKHPEGDPDNVRSTGSTRAPKETVSELAGHANDLLRNVIGDIPPGRSAMRSLSKVQLEGDLINLLHQTVNNNTSAFPFKEETLQDVLKDVHRQFGTPMEELTQTLLKKAGDLESAKPFVILGKAMLAKSSRDSSAAAEKMFLDPSNANQFEFLNASALNHSILKGVFGIARESGRLLQLHKKVVGAESITGKADEIRRAMINQVIFGDKRLAQLKGGRLAKMRDFFKQRKEIDPDYKAPAGFCD